MSLIHPICMLCKTYLADVVALLLFDTSATVFVEVRTMQSSLLPAGKMVYAEETFVTASCRKQGRLYLRCIVVGMTSLSRANSTH